MDDTIHAVITVYVALSFVPS